MSRIIKNLVKLRYPANQNILMYLGCEETTNYHILIFDVRNKMKLESCNLTFGYFTLIWIE